jgi:hypothetical protein
MGSLRDTFVIGPVQMEASSKDFTPRSASHSARIIWMPINILVCPLIRTLEGMTEYVTWLEERFACGH